MSYVDYFKKDLTLVNSYLDKELPAATKCPPIIHEAMRYAVLGAGKRFRPILAIATAKACGGNAKSVLPAAAAIELIHAYSLVHDDLPALDNDDLRRGEPSCHKKFGEAMAILAGDGLLTLAFEWVGRMKPGEAALKALSELSTAAGTFGMIGGQVADIAVKDRDMAMLDYISIHKTGCLIRSAAVIGALSASASPGLLRDMNKYGECLGLAFQIADDLVDADGYLSQMTDADAQERVRDLIAQAKRAVRKLGDKAKDLVFIADDLVARMEQASLY